MIYSKIEAFVPNDPQNPQAVLDLLAFLLEKTVFIAVQSSIDMARVFGVFESINSKGKPLADIDLIKTYIFSVLDEADYGTYLTRWGQLIIKTDDNLTDYFETYINAFLFFYKQKINLKEFKKISRNLPRVYGVATEAEALKRLLDDMLARVGNYEYLNNEAAIEKQITIPAFITFFRLFKAIGYEHPRPLIFRAFCDYFNVDENDNPAPLINRKDVADIVKASTLFLFKSQSIRGGDSKDAIKYFKDVAQSYYNKPNIIAKDVVATFSNALIKEGINKDVIKQSFISIDFYSKHDLAYSVLSLLESIDTTKNNKLLYSQASMMLSHIKDQTFHIDHMLPQHPDPADKKFSYYADSSSGEELLVLKPGNDFPTNSVMNGMKYEVFESMTLHRLGNIRLYLPQLNSSKGNAVTHLPAHQDFTTYKQIIDRCDELADLLVNSPDLA